MRDGGREGRRGMKAAVSVGRAEEEEKKIIYSPPLLPSFLPSFLPSMAF